MISVVIITYQIKGTKKIKKKNESIRGLMI
jgi:hypothetical protein